jgi:hypothetical protein
MKYFILLTLLSLSLEAATTKRAPAQVIRETELSKDMRVYRDQWLKVRTGDELQNLLVSIRNNKSLSPDMKYFNSELELLLPFRGIIWRARPIVETKNLLHVKTTQVMAVQLVRAFLINLRMLIPTSQSDALFEYLTVPSQNMKREDQFKGMEDVQEYLLKEVLPVVQKQISVVEALAQGKSQTFIWDNHIAYLGGQSQGEGSGRFIVHGPAEIHSRLAELHKMAHDIYAFYSYDQKEAMLLVQKMGTHMAIDSSFLVGRSSRLGMTDEERGKVIKTFMVKHHYLDKRPQGDAYMKKALASLRDYVTEVEKAQSIVSSERSLTYPLVLNNGVTYHLSAEVMSGLVDGPYEMQDPVSGIKILLNLPAFYESAPQSFAPLLATSFDHGPNTVTVKNKDEELLEARNYLQGKALSWDNNEWKKFVPSAEGKGPAYINEARRVFHQARQLSFMFLLPEIIVH